MPMTDHQISRVGIVASVVGAVGAIVFLLTGSKPGPQGVPGPAGTGTPGSPNFSGTSAGGTTPPAPVSGNPTTRDIAISNTVLGSDLGDVITNFGGPSNVLENVNNYFVNNLYETVAAGGAIPADSPPSRKPSPVSHSGCGCGGGEGKTPKCGGNSCCANAGPPYRWTDGAGGCFSSSYGSLTDSMESCMPDFANRMLVNMAQATPHYGIAQPQNLEELGAAISYGGFRAATIRYDARGNYTAPAFG